MNYQEAAGLEINSDLRTSLRRREEAWKFKPPILPLAEIDANLRTSFFIALRRKSEGVGLKIQPKSPFRDRSRIGPILATMRTAENSVILAG